MTIIGIDLGTSNSAAAVLKGLPVFGSERRGDLNLRIDLRVPGRLGREERELYVRLRKLREKGGGDRR